MSAINVLGACVVLWVVREVNGGHVVYTEGRGLRRWKPELREERSQVDRLFGRFRRGHDLGFTRRECNRGLFLRGPRNCSLTINEYVPRGGMSRCPIGVREAVHVVVLHCDIAKAHVPMMIQIHEDAPRVIQQGTRGAAHSPAQHAYGVRHVGARLRGTVKQGPHEGHVLTMDVWVDASFDLREERGSDVLGQVFSGRRMRSAKTGWNAV
eukprot:5603169-Pleurochrysis_carterae.AAC.1